MDKIMDKINYCQASESIATKTGDEIFFLRTLHSYPVGQIYVEMRKLYMLKQ